MICASSERPSTNNISTELSEGNQRELVMNITQQEREKDRIIQKLKSENIQLKFNLSEVGTQLDQKTQQFDFISKQREDLYRETKHLKEALRAHKAEKLLRFSGGVGEELMGERSQSHRDITGTKITIYIYIYI